MPASSPSMLPPRARSIIGYPVGRGKIARADDVAAPEEHNRVAVGVSSLDVQQLHRLAVREQVLLLDEVGVGRQELAAVSPVDRRLSRFVRDDRAPPISDRRGRCSAAMSSPALAIAAVPANVIGIAVVFTMKRTGWSERRIASSKRARCAGLRIDDENAVAADCTVVFAPRADEHVERSHRPRLDLAAGVDESATSPPRARSPSRQRARHRLPAAGVLRVASAFAALSM